MAQTYLLFDFGSDEQKLQQARHKLERWKQAFRLDKKLQYKIEREPASGDGKTESAPEAGAAKPDQPKSAKSKAKPKSAKSKSADPEANSEDRASEKHVSENQGDVKLLVRLYFSGHEKLSEQRWIDRIPTEEPFKDASPKVVKETEPGFADILKQFDSLE